MLFFSDNGRWPGENDYDRLNSYMTGHIQLQAWDEDSGVYAIRWQEALRTVYAAVRVADEFGGSPRIREFLERDSSEYGLLNGELSSYQSTDPVVAVKIKDIAPGSGEDGQDDSSSSDGSGGDPGQDFGAQKRGHADHAQDGDHARQGRRPCQRTGLGCVLCHACQRHGDRGR